MDPVTEKQGSARSATRRFFLAPKDCLALLAIALLTLLFFFKTIFAGGTISRLCVLAEWDSVFDAWRTGHAQAYDPSLVQIFLPDYVFLAQNLSKGILPLWNQHCGLGYPFLADIQSSVFAPIRMIYNFFPSMQSYNLYLIAELFVCAVSSFFLARALGLARLPSVFAAIAYSFCPYNMWYMEMNLGASSCLYPLCALGFVNAAERRNLGSAILAGLTAGLLILSGHPECSFFGIILSSAFLFLLSPQVSTWLSSLRLLILAALSTVAVSAPALFPFLEYLLNGESYKYGSTYSTPVSWNGIFFNLCNPGVGGASPFLGIITLFLLPLSLLALQRQNRERGKKIALFAITALTFLLVSQLGPVEILFSKPPLTAIITRYALPYLLMLFALLAGSGLTELAQIFERREPSKLEFWLCVFALALFPVVAFALCGLISSHAAFMKVADFDAMLPRTALNASALKRDIICTVVFSSIVFALLYASKQLVLGRNGKILGAIATVAALVCAFISQASIGKLSLPLQSKFFYPETELIQKLKDNQYRSISTCEYVFRPATNAVYGVNFLTVHNPLFPKRFLEFTRASGARTDVFNQVFDADKLSPLLNLASVKYILSLKPLVDQNSPERFKLFYESKNGIKIFENTEAAPRAYIIHGVRGSKNAEASLTLVSSDELKPRDEAIIEYTPDFTGSGVESQPASASSTTYEAVDKFESINSNALHLECNCKTAPSWLVLTDIHYPGWNAYVDGQKTHIYKANYAFRAIKLEQGKHSVDFKYEPISFTIGAAVFTIFLLLAAAILWSPAKKWKV